MAETKGADQGLLVGVALSGSKKSKYILKWALEKFLPEGNVTFKLLHVYPKITIVPTEMGTWLPVAQVREDVVTGYRQETEWRKQKKILPFKKSLKAQKINADIVLLESDDISMALSLEIGRQAIRHLVIGNTTAGIFSMKNLIRGEDVSLSISENAPSFCSVYVVADGKLQQLRPADSEPNVITMDDTSNLSSTSIDSLSSSSSLSIGRFLKNTSPIYGRSATTTHASQPNQIETYPRNAAGAKVSARETIEPKHYTFKDTHYNSGNASAQSHSSVSGDSGSWVSERTTPEGSFVGVQSEVPTSFVATPMTGSYISTPAISPVGTPPTGSFMGTPIGTPPGGSFVGTPPGGSFVSTPPGGSFVGTPIGTPPGGSFVGTPPLIPYGRTPPSASFLGVPSGPDTGETPKHKAELEKLRMELKHFEKMYELTQNSNIDEKLQDISKERLEEAIKLKEEKGKEIASINKSKHRAVQSVDIDSRGEVYRNQPNNKADSTATRNQDSKNRFKELFASQAIQYQKFTWEEIMDATSSLSDEYKIGAEILTTIRHPHLLLLLGAVPEESCLVYEYMDYGSLEDRLFRKNNKAPLPWYDRFRICCEVASALAFLHSTKPRPIIHRDLKPANILLDHNLVSKIGDAGLGTMINVEPSNVSLKTIYKETSPVGTLCYIDPEYQRTGRVSTKSDVYALGVVILQLLTAKPAVGIAFMVEDAIDEGTLMDVLDPEAGEWPKKETLELALLGLQCAELRGRDRPVLKEKVLPMLERLKEVADKARESASIAPAATPEHFFCPILKDVMEDPYVAADGYTYDRRAIEQWLKENDISPTTNQPLPHKFIMPNTTMLEAINQWKSKKASK